MNAQPFFFCNDRHHLYGILYRPVKNIKRVGFVFCDAFAEEKLWSQRVMVAFAKRLADQGYWVLLFDYMGNGESEGDFEQTTLSSMISDAQCAVQKLLRKEKNLQKINLLGLRLGATVAAQVAAHEKNIGKLVMWAPVFDGKEYIKELFRINFSTQLIIHKRVLYNSENLVQKMRHGDTVNLDGYELTYRLYNEILKQNLNSICMPKEISVFIGNVGKSDKHFHNVKNKLRMDSLWTYRVIEENHFWKESKYVLSTAENLFQETEKWLNCHDH